MWDDLVAWDQAAFRFINSSYFNRFNDFWLFVTHIEYWLPLYLLFFFLLFKRYKRYANLIAMSFIPIIAVLTLWLTNLVKNYIARLRPNNEPVLMDSIITLQSPENFSFWSGHSAVSFAVTTFVVLALRKKYRWCFIFYIWPVLFALSRIFVGVHYPLDVTVGAVVGLILGLLFYKVFIKLAQFITHDLK